MEMVYMEAPTPSRPQSKPPQTGTTLSPTMSTWIVYQLARFPYADIYFLCLRNQKTPPGTDIIINSRPKMIDVTNASFASIPTYANPEIMAASLTPHPATEMGKMVRSDIGGTNTTHSTNPIPTPSPLAIS